MHAFAKLWILASLDYSFHSLSALRYLETGRAVLYRVLRREGTARSAASEFRRDASRAGRSGET